MSSKIYEKTRFKFEKPENKPRSLLNKINTVSYDCSQNIILILLRNCTTIYLVYLLALYRECKTHPRRKCTQRIPYYSTIRASMLAVEQTHRFAMHELKINTVGTCNDAPFRPRVSIHLLSVACLPSCMITRAVVKCC